MISLQISTRISTQLHNDFKPKKIHNTHCPISTSLSSVNRFECGQTRTSRAREAAEKQKQKLLSELTRLQMRINYDSFFLVLQAALNPAVHVELIELFTPEGTHIKLRRRSFDAARLCKNDRKKKRVPLKM
jgi:hypothetical protein